MTLYFIVQSFEHIWILRFINNIIIISMYYTAKQHCQTTHSTGSVHIRTFEIQGYLRTFKGNLKKKFKTVLTTYVLLSTINEVNIKKFTQLRKQWCQPQSNADCPMCTRIIFCA